MCRSSMRITCLHNILLHNVSLGDALSTEENIVERVDETSTSTLFSLIDVIKFKETTLPNYI